MELLRGLQTNGLQPSFLCNVLEVRAICSIGMPALLWRLAGDLLYHVRFAIFVEIQRRGRWKILF